MSLLIRALREGYPGLVPGGLPMASRLELGVGLPMASVLAAPEPPLPLLQRLTDRLALARDVIHHRATQP